MPLFVASPNGLPNAAHAVPSLANATSVPGSLTEVAPVGRTRVQVTPLSAEHQIPDGIVVLVRPRTPAKRILFLPDARFTAKAPMDGPPRMLDKGAPPVR